MIQLVMAHPDDEVIFGWPVLQKVGSILICSNDRNNSLRAWCRYRYQALQEVGELLGIEVKSLDYDSDFYKLNARDGSLKHWMNEVYANIRHDAEYIYTHNWMGEYGHLDHILVYLTMLKTGKKLITSDIHMESDWLSFPEIPIDGRPGRAISKCVIDMEFYAKCKAIYDKHGVWTWNQPPVCHCDLIRL